MTRPDLIILRQKLAGLLMEIERMQREAVDMEMELRLKEAENEE